MAASPYKVLAQATRTIKETGVADQILFASMTDFDPAGGLKCPAAGEVIISDDHEFVVDKGFIKLTCAPTKQKLTASITGETGNLKLMNKLEVFVPGSDKELHKLIKLVKNDQLVILVKDAECDAEQFYQLGCDCNGAFLDPEGGWESGTTKDGVKGYKLAFSYPAGNVVLYQGVITYHP
jgi:hypothetical protein